MGDARCATHEEREAVVGCHRCGRFLCEGCLSPPPPGVEAPGLLCHPCAAIVGSPPSARARWVFRLGVASLVGTLGLPCLAGPLVFAAPLVVLTGPLAVALSFAELAAIARGDAPALGASLVQRGRFLGLVQLALAAAIIAVLLRLRGADLLRVD